MFILIFQERTPRPGRTYSLSEPPSASVLLHQPLYAIDETNEPDTSFRISDTSKSDTTLFNQSLLAEGEEEDDEENGRKLSVTKMHNVDDQRVLREVEQGELEGEEDEDENERETRMTKMHNVETETQRVLREEKQEQEEELDVIKDADDDGEEKSNTNLQKQNDDDDERGEEDEDEDDDDEEMCRK